MTDRPLIVDGTTLEARRIAGVLPHGPTLVFLHEGLGSAAQWRDFPDRVCNRLGLGALVYSRQGYGNSDAVPAVPRPVNFMHDEAYRVLPLVLRAEGIMDAVLVGHSDGASIALLYAAQDRGATARAVVALAPHVFVEDLTIASIAAITKTWHSTELRARLARHHGTNVDGAFLGWSGAWLSPDFRAWDITQEVRAVTVPVLVIQGEDDPYGTVAQVTTIARIAHGKVTTRMLPHCGHAPPRDKPEETLTAIVDWWREYEATTAGESSGGR